MSEPADSGDLFGTASRQYSGIGYAATPGSGPAGETCGSCAFMTGRRFHKCAIGIVSNGAATDDIRVSAPACRLWTKVGSRLCDRCVFLCPMDGEPACSAPHRGPELARPLGVGAPLCRGKQFRRAAVITLREGQVLVDGQPLDGGQPG